MARRIGWSTAEFLTANKNGNWLALSANVSVRRAFCGYVGTTGRGNHNLSSNFKVY